MKKIYPILFLSFILMLLSYTGGAPYGYTGSPGDSNRTCSVCHTFSGTTPTPSISLTGFPSNGNIVAGTTYHLTLDISGVSNTKYGFQITAEDANHQKTGIFSSVDNNTQSLSSGKSLGHKSQGTSQHTWHFDWQAPNPTKTSAENQDITLYYACNLTNNNNADTGDYIATGSLNVYLGSANIETLDDKAFKIYPNPVENILYFNSHLGKISRIEIMDVTGKTYPIKVSNQMINVSSLAKGNYFLHVKTGRQNGLKQFIKK